MIDEISICQYVEWAGFKFCGYVDLGTGLIDDSNPVATEALVFMIVAFNDNWKIPVGYFSGKGLSGTEQVNLIIQCVSKLYDNGVVIVSLTCDGPSLHFSIMTKLGAKLNPCDHGFLPSMPSKGFLSTSFRFQSYCSHVV